MDILKTAGGAFGVALMAALMIFSALEPVSVRGAGKAATQIASSEGNPAQAAGARARI